MLLRSSENGELLVTEVTGEVIRDTLVLWTEYSTHGSHLLSSCS